MPLERPEEAADKHATAARRLAKRAEEHYENNPTEAGELASLALAHGVAALSTVLASGVVTQVRG